jgi:hypothetical protein
MPTFATTPRFELDLMGLPPANRGPGVPRVVWRRLGTHKLLDPGPP